MRIQNLSIPSSRYKKSVSLTKPYPAIKFNGIPKFDKLETKYEHGIWGEMRKSLKQNIFGISTAGITVEREEISIDPEQLRTNVFYLFSYKDEKYVARKIDGDVVEIFEVIE